MQDYTPVQYAVLREKAHIGIALDGDADRLTVVDEKGDVKDGDQLLVIAMNPGGFAGLVSWIDSAPPGVEYIGY